jgi:hypothetical protein
MATCFQLQEGMKFGTACSYLGAVVSPSRSRGWGVSICLPFVPQEEYAHLACSAALEQVDRLDSLTDGKAGSRRWIVLGAALLFGPKMD